MSTLQELLMNAPLNRDDPTFLNKLYKELQRHGYTGEEPHNKYEGLLLNPNRIVDLFNAIQENISLVLEKFSYSDSNPSEDNYAHFTYVDNRKFREDFIVNSFSSIPDGYLTYYHLSSLEQRLIETLDTMPYRNFINISMGLGTVNVILRRFKLDWKILKADVIHRTFDIRFVTYHFEIFIQYLHSLMDCRENCKIPFDFECESDHIIMEMFHYSTASNGLDRVCKRYMITPK